MVSGETSTVRNAAAIAPAGPNSGGQKPFVPTARQFFLSPPFFDHDQHDELEGTLFASIQLPNRVMKTTCPRRLDDLNEVVQAWLPEPRPLHVMDAAVSTGITTWEWSEFLRQHGIEHFITAGDLNTHAYLFSLGSSLHALVDETGRPWQFEVNGKAVRNPPGKRNLLRYLPKLLTLKLAIRLWFGSLREASRKQGHQPVQRGPFMCRPLSLVNARLRQLPNVRILEDDLRIRNSALDQQFHVLRVANFLNKACFDDATITAILMNLRSRLKRGGVLVICRTEDQGQNNGSVFRLDPMGNFTTLARIGDGSEIEYLVLELPF